MKVKKRGIAVRYEGRAGSYVGVVRNTTTQTLLQMKINWQLPLFGLYRERAHFSIDKAERLLSVPTNRA